MITKQPKPVRPKHGWLPEVVSYLYKVGVGEDGEDEHGLFFTVRVTNERGDRYRHQHQWANGGNVNKTRECESEAEKLLARVMKAHHTWAPTEPFWQVTESMYGTESYVEHQHEYAQQEREEDERSR